MIKKVNGIPTHCGVAYESFRSEARGHVIRVEITHVSNAALLFVDITFMFHDLLIMTSQIG